MSVPVAYATIIIVWSTTPLGITWSNETVSPFAAVLLRMSIAAIVGLAVLRLAKIPMIWTRPALKTYAYSLLGIFVALTITYIAAQYVPSGVISVIYALSPIMSTLLAAVIVGQGDFSRAKWAAFILSCVGLGVIFLDDWVIDGNGLLGLLMLLTAVFLYSLNGVMVQKIKLEAHPLSITVCTLLLSIPLFTLSWGIFDGDVPKLDWSSRSPYAILYLAVFGSLLGFACYFYIVKQLGATAVAMVTLMTPVIALIAGNMFNNEPITVNTVIGTGCVLCGLALYYGESYLGRAGKQMVNAS